MSSVITCDVWSRFSDISHGFLTRTYGNHPSQGIPVGTICSVDQVHGVQTLLIGSHDQILKAPKTQADILMTHLPDIALVIRTADCVPILFFDPVKRVVGAAHAGWRGSAAGVSKETIARLAESYHSRASDLWVALGPAIQDCCYEVDEKVYDRISMKACFQSVPGKKGRWKLSLPSLNVSQLVSEGVPLKHIWVSPLCTSCLKDRFFSYRREGERAGRQWSFIALNGAR